MSFFKTAFARRDHKAITKYIMGTRFDEALFEQVHRYIDRVRGVDHREKHGHDQKAEEEIKTTWGDTGVEIFKIHILSDWLHDNLGLTVQSYYEDHIAGSLPLPYYSKDAQNPTPSSREEPARSAVCANCDSKNDLQLRGWMKGLVCSQCFEVRNLEVCHNCRAFLAKHDRKPSPVSDGHYLCPVCVPLYADEFAQADEQNNDPV